MIIDTKLSIKKSNGNVELAKELLLMLINELPKSLEKIKLAYQSGSTKELLEQSHRLHGATAYCGVPALKSTTQKLESSIKNANNDEIQLNLDNVEIAIKTLIKQAPKILDNDWLE